MAKSVINTKKVSGKNKVVCQICNKEFVTLKRHLATKHQLDPSEYKKICDDPVKCDLIAIENFETIRFDCAKLKKVTYEERIRIALLRQKYQKLLSRKENEEKNNKAVVPKNSRSKILPDFDKIFEQMEGGIIWDF